MFHLYIVTKSASIDERIRQWQAEIDELPMQQRKMSCKLAQTADELEAEVMMSVQAERNK